MTKFFRSLLEILHYQLISNSIAEKIFKIHSLNRHIIIDCSMSMSEKTGFEISLTSLALFRKKKSQLSFQLFRLVGFRCDNNCVFKNIIKMVRVKKFLYCLSLENGGNLIKKIK